MPYKSDAQRKFFHTNTAKEAGITDKEVKEFDQASKGKDLPEKVKKMADGGTTAGNPSELDPGIKDATTSDFLLPYLLGPSLGKAAEEVAPALKGLGEAGEVTIGRAAPAMEDAVAGATTNDVTPMKLGDVVTATHPSAPPVKLQYRAPSILKNSPPDAMFNILDEVPAPGKPWAHPVNSTLSKSTLESYGYKVPEGITEGTVKHIDVPQAAPNAYAKGGPVLRSSLEHQVPNGMMARAMSDGGFPHVTFLENESPAQVKKDTHMEGTKATPMNTTETGEKKNPAHMAEGGPVLKAENREKEPARPANVDMSHENKLKAIYKAMGMKKYADGGQVSPSDGTINVADLPSGGNGAPSPNDPGFWDAIKAALSKVAAPAAMPGLAEGAANAAATPGIAPAINAALNTNLPGPAASAAPAAPPVAAPTVLPSAAAPRPPIAAPTAALPGASNVNMVPKDLFNEDTSKLTAGVNAEDRQALVNKLQSQQHGIGSIIAESIAGLGDALAAKGGKEQHSLQNIFSMQKEQRAEALNNFDKARQDRLEKLDLQTKMGNNAIQKLAAQDAYGTDEHLNKMLGAPPGTAHKDLPLYFQAKSAQVAQQEKDADLYMKAHAQAGTDVDNAVSHASVLGMKPSSAQIQASGAKLADQYFNRAKGNVLVKPSDGGPSQWIPAANIGKAKQMDPNLQVQP